MSRPARAMEGAVGALETSVAQQRILINRKAEEESAWLRSAIEKLRGWRRPGVEGQENRCSDVALPSKETKKASLRRSKRHRKVSNDLPEAPDQSAVQSNETATLNRGKRKSQARKSKVVEAEEKDENHSDLKPALSPVEEVEPKPEVVSTSKEEHEKEAIEAEQEEGQASLAKDMAMTGTSKMEQMAIDMDEVKVVPSIQKESIDEDTIAQQPRARSPGMSPITSNGASASHHHDGGEIQEEDKPSEDYQPEYQTEALDESMLQHSNESREVAPETAILQGEDENAAWMPQESTMKDENSELKNGFQVCKTPGIPAAPCLGPDREVPLEQEKHTDYKTPAASVTGLSGENTGHKETTDSEKPNFSADQLKARLQRLKDRTSPIEESREMEPGADAVPVLVADLGPSPSEDASLLDKGVLHEEGGQSDELESEQGLQKKTVKVAALQAAELARAAQKAKEEQRKLRKEKFEQAKLAKQMESSAGSTGTAAQKIQKALEMRAKLAENARAAREEESRKRREAFQKREEEALARRKAKEEEEMRALEERRRRQEEIRQRQLALEERRRLAMEERERTRRAFEEAEQERATAEEQARLKRQAEKRAEIERRRKEAEEAAQKARLAAEESRERQRMAEAMFKQEQEAIWHAGQAGGNSISPYLGGRLGQVEQPQVATVESQGVSAPPALVEGHENGTTKPSLVPIQSKAPTPQQKRLINPSEYTSYEISPYKEDEDSEDDDERPRKPVPNWARSGPLGIQLRFQEATDPDAIFQAPGRTCNLEDMFHTTGNKRKRDWNRRSSSGNWNDDQLSYAEIIHYKRVMGYVDG